MSERATGIESNASTGPAEHVLHVRNRRRKEARPDEILDAALAEFAEHGYADARLDRVALRVIAPQMSTIAALTQTFTGSTEEFIRGPFKQALLHLLRSDARHLARIILTEGRNFPDLTEFFAREVVQRGLNML